MIFDANKISAQTHQQVMDLLMKTKNTIAISICSLTEDPGIVEIARIADKDVLSVAEHIFYGACGCAMVTRPGIKPEEIEAHIGVLLTAVGYQKG